MRAALPALLAAPVPLAAAHFFAVLGLPRGSLVLPLVVPPLLFAFAWLGAHAGADLAQRTRALTAAMLASLSLLALVLVPSAQAWIDDESGWSLLPVSFWLLVVAAALAWRAPPPGAVAVAALVPVLGLLATNVGKGDLGSDFETNLQMCLLVPAWFPLGLVLAGRLGAARHPAVGAAVVAAGPLLALGAFQATTLWSPRGWRYLDVAPAGSGTALALRMVELALLLAVATGVIWWLARLSRRHGTSGAWAGAAVAGVPLWFLMLPWLHDIPT